MPNVSPNCTISDEAKTGQRVLVPSLKQTLDLESLLAATDAKEVVGLMTPATAVWKYAQLPKQPPVQSHARMRTKLVTNINVVQFAVGGRVYPTLEHWVRVTERFRGRVLKNIAERLTGMERAKFGELSTCDRERFSGISGKDSTGKPLSDHSHAYFALYPDESGFPTRLLCYRANPFLPDEIEAMYAASDHPMSWRHPSGSRNDDDWQIRMIPLPSETPPPTGFRPGTPAIDWESVTPYIPQGGRHRFRKNGRLRPGETPERLLDKLLNVLGLPLCEIQQVDVPTEWVVVHETLKQRRARQHRSTRNVRQGFRFRLRFREPQTGPILLGHSSHYGLGMFQAVESAGR